MYLTEVVLEVKPTEEKPTELATLELEFKEAPKPIQVTKPKIPWRGPDDFEVVIEKFDETKVVTTTEEVVSTKEVTVEEAPTPSVTEVQFDVEEKPMHEDTTLEIVFEKEEPTPEVTMIVEDKPEG